MGEHELGLVEGLDPALTMMDDAVVRRRTARLFATTRRARGRQARGRSGDADSESSRN